MIFICMFSVFFIFIINFAGALGKSDRLLIARTAFFHQFSFQLFQFPVRFFVSSDWATELTISESVWSELVMAVAVCLGQMLVMGFMAYSLRSLALGRVNIWENIKMNDLHFGPIGVLILEIYLEFILK